MQRVGKLFLLFTAVPLLELFLLTRLAGVMGFGTTILLVIVTGVLGASLARSQGLRVLGEWQRALAQGRVPESGVTDALLVVVGGVLLVTPGVLTDAFGLLMMFRGPRRVMGGLLGRYFQGRVVHRDIGGAGGMGGPGVGPMGGMGGMGGPGMGPMGPFPGTGHGTGQGVGQAASRPRANVPGDRDVIRVKATVSDVEPDAD